ncbi:hypothetical protein [Leptothrix ochracea]|uniref:hypothetical protein n=2 Tax=Leptothrix ochracea TaxID=735331 RepID=UPI0034E212D1
MIRVAPAPEPEDFDGKVRQPGRRAIAEMVGYQVIPDTNLPPDMAQKVQTTIDRLKLNDYECLKLREEYAEAFLRGDVSQAHLHKRAPFLAREIERAALQEEVVVVVA